MSPPNLSKDVEAMTIKEELFALMERIALPWPRKAVTVIICCEADADSLCSMVGYRNERGTGTVLHITATPETVSSLMADAWNAANKTNRTKDDDKQ